MSIFPYRYEDYAMRDLAEVKHEERVTVEGKVHSFPVFAILRQEKSRLTFRVLVGRYLINAVCFNRPYYKDKVKMDETVTITGKWDQHRQTISVTEVHFGALVRPQDVEPVYSIKGKLTVKQMRRFISQALQQYGQYVNDPLPDGLLQRYKLLQRRAALQALHFSGRTTGCETSTQTFCI
ncbi:hypothetical protein GCM10020331_047440 [Ectobacillus funiculus]